jgi:hypothetical protein
MSEEKDRRKLLEIPHFRILSIIALATVLSWAAWILVVWNLDPWTETGLSLALFFVSTFLACAGSFSIILFFLKRWRSGDYIFVKHVLISLRQGVLLSLCTCICLTLLMLGLLRIWNGLLLVAFIMLLEFYLSGKDELN